MVLQNRKGFESTDMVTIQQLKFRSIVVQTGPCTCSSAQVLAEYLKSIVDENPYIISNTQDFPTIVKAEITLQID